MATLAKKGTAKYDEQVWCGLIDDPRRAAELAQARVPAKLGPMGHAQGAGVVTPQADPAGLPTPGETQAP